MSEINSPYALYKDRFLTELVTHTGNGFALTTKHFAEKYELKDSQVQDIMRHLAMSEQNYLICSTSKGYYIAKNRDEALHGFSYLANRIEEQEKRKENFQKKLNHLFPEESQAELFSADKL